MLSRSLNLALRFSPHRGALQIALRNTSTDAEANAEVERDPAPYFFNNEIQHLLKTITRPNPDIVFRRQLNSQALEAPEYKFMTDEQLQKAMRKAEDKMWYLLHMPPVVKIRKENTKIVSNDPAIQGAIHCKHVFTDITFGLKDKDRIITVREPNGILRMATNAERDRLIQIYFPKPGREIDMPRMFLAENLEPILERADYEFILNRACVQFDPDHEVFHRVTKTTYEYVDKKIHHDKLRSTRHYGPLVFHLAWNKSIDNLLFENISTGRIEDAAIVIRILYLLNPDLKSIEEKDPIKLIRHYIETESATKQKLKSVLNGYLELEAEKKKAQQQITKAHGRRTRKNEDKQT